MSNNFDNEQHLAKFVEKLGGTLWLVGGALRDQLMGLNPTDRDYVITGLDILDVPFDRIAGNSFPVFLVKIDGKSCEVAMARKEIKSGVGYKGFTFHTDKNLSIVDDIARRDLTINAIARNVLSGDLVDVHGGIKDITKGIIRHTTDAFGEDPLRVYRVARFAAKFGFTISLDTLVFMSKMKEELNHLSSERVWQETLKALNTSNPRRFFEVLRDIDVLDLHFPELHALNVPDQHDGTTFNHIMNIINFGKSPLERFGLLVHDLGKGITGACLKGLQQYEHGIHNEHTKLGESQLLKLCNRLKISNDYRDFGLICVKEHMRIKYIKEMRPSKIIKMILRSKPYIYDIIRVSYIDSIHRIHTDEEYLDVVLWWNDAQTAAEIVLKLEQEITGKQLIEEGYKEGPNIGEILLQRRIQAFKDEW